jgi:hypothetical protein
VAAVAAEHLAAEGGGVGRRGHRHHQNHAVHRRSLWEDVRSARFAQTLVVCSDPVLSTTETGGR